MSVAQRLTLPVGEAIFTLRAIRRFRPDPIPDSALNDILQATIRAPSGGNLQTWHFVVLKDPGLRAQFGVLYREAWWAKRRDVGIHGPQDIPPANKMMLSAMRLADEIGQAPVIIVVCATEKGAAAMGNAITATENLLLAARALGIGGTITTLHPQVEARVHALLGIPAGAQVVYCVPLGYPQGRFGPTRRRPLPKVCSQDRWGATPLWAKETAD